MDVCFAEMANGVASKSNGAVTKHITALSVKSIDVEKRQIRVLASSADLDRYNERILPEAFKKRLATFMENPVVLVGHNHKTDSGRAPVVGRVTKAWIDKEGLWCILELTDKTPLAEEYWQLYKDGYMKAVSIGFIPITSHTEDEDGKRVLIYDEVELLEISLVAVPANRQALVKSKQKKADWLENKKRERLGQTDDKDELAPWMRDVDGRGYDEDERFLEQMRAEYAAQGRDFDAECEEFGDLLMSGDIPLGDEVVCEEETEIDFAAIIQGKSRSVFAKLVNSK